MATFVIIFIIGIMGGLLSGLLGVGAGTVFIPGLTYITSISQHYAQGIALGAMIPIVIIGFLRYHRQGTIDFTIAAILIIGSISGAYIGAHTAVMVPEKTLKILFGFFMFSIGLQMLISKRNIDD